jgi:5-methylthioribose kinase
MQAQAQAGSISRLHTPSVRPTLSSHTPCAQGVFRDALGFAGCKMMRRIVGVAHVADFTSIADVELRAQCERRALRFGRQLLVNAGSFTTIEAVTQGAETARTAAM